MNNNLVAVYGTLRKGFGFSGALASSKFITKGKTTEKMTLRISGYPTVSKDEKTSQIVVEVYEINELVLKHLDFIEGHPNYYKRELTQISGDDGKSYEAWLYYCKGSSGELVESGDFEEYYKATM